MCRGCLCISCKYAYSNETLEGCKNTCDTSCPIYLVDNDIRITECELYEKYIEGDEMNYE